MAQVLSGHVRGAWFGRREPGVPCTRDQGWSLVAPADGMTGQRAVAPAASSTDPREAGSGKALSPVVGAAALAPGFYQQTTLVWNPNLTGVAEITAPSRLNP